jgi:hypothetical protein
MFLGVFLGMFLGVFLATHALQLEILGEELHT